MKKRVRLVLAAIFATCCMILILAGCDWFNTTVNYKLYFRVDGDVYATISTTGDEVISLPDDPEKDGYAFDGWFWDNNVWKKPFTAISLLDAPISSNISVYAKFISLHEHEPSEDWSYDAENHWKTCSCGEQVDFGAHQWSDWVVEESATKEKAGSETRTCVVCGQKERRTIGQLPDEQAKQNYDMSGVSFSDGAITYDGQQHSIFISGVLPVGVSVRYENNEQTDAGEYYVTAIFTGDSETHNSIPSMTAVLTIRKAKINISNLIFENQIVEYDGEPHSLIVQNLPYGLSQEDITYYYNGQERSGVSEPGEYTVIASFRELKNYESIDNLRATLTIFGETYQEKYEQYGVLGKTIDLLHADSITSTLAGGKSVFSDKLMGINVYRQDLGKQVGVSESSSDISEVMDKFSASIDAKVSFGSRKNKNGGFLTNLLPSLNVSGSGSYQKVKKSETNTYSYMYNYLMNGYRVDIEGYRDPSKFVNMISDELISDAEKIRNGSLSPEKFVQMWGTHVIMSAIYGEKVDVTYTAIANKDLVEENWQANIAAEFEKRFLKTGLDVSIEASASNLTTNSTSSQIQKLQINVMSKNVLAATSMTQFENAYSEWRQGDHSQYSVFTDVPDDSLYCIWYLLGDEYSDVINTLDNFMYSQCSELYNSRLSAIYSFMLADDFEFDSKNQELTLNLNSYQEKGDASKFEATYFDHNTGILTVNPAINGTPIKKITINGAYNLKNQQGQSITRLIDKFSLRFDKDWSEDLEITLNNVGFKTGNNLSAFDFSEVTEEINVVCTANGVNEICGGSGVSAGSAIKGNLLNLTIQSPDAASSLILKGGNGAVGDKLGANGSNGGNAIIAEVLSINAAGTLLIQGGNGGNGASGISYDPWNGASQASNGGKGGNGGNGGSAVTCSTIFVNNGKSIDFIGGNGGTGASGGSGEGSNGNDVARGGVGGAGGSGGNGASCIIASVAFYNNSTANTLHLTSGSGGVGGCGGQGGHGLDTNRRDSGGDGGTGGNGGHSGYCIECKSVTTLSTIRITLGKGGDAGNGGTGGNAYRDGVAGDRVYIGNGGQGGNGGNCLVDTFLVSSDQYDIQNNAVSGHGGTGGTAGGGATGTGWIFFGSGGNGGNSGAIYAGNNMLISANSGKAGVQGGRNKTNNNTSGTSNQGGEGGKAATYYFNA